MEVIVFIILEFFFLHQARFSLIIMFSIFDVLYWLSIISRLAVLIFSIQFYHSESRLFNASVPNLGNISHITFATYVNCISSSST